MTRVSVVLPVYNVERYLAACLASVRGQSHGDLEIICVDDGSTDGSPALLRMAADLDPRVVVVTKPNGGLSSARNAGLRVATGEVVMFVDSDDFLDSRAAEVVVRAFGETDAEVVTFGAHVQPPSRTTPWLERTLSPRRVTYDGFRPPLLFAEDSRPFVWRSAFTRAFLAREDLTFDEGVRFGEDQVFYFAAYPVARRVTLIPDKLYFYRVARPESLMASRFAKRETMLVEHHHIARTILGLWRERGWLAAHPVDLLAWVFEFLGEDAVTSRGALRGRLVGSLAGMLTEFFPDGTVPPDAPRALLRLREAFVAAGDTGGGAVLVARFWAWRSRGDVPTTLRRAAGRVLRGLRRRLRGGRAAAEARLAEEREDRQDEVARERARAALQAEWEARPIAPAGG